MEPEKQKTQGKRRRLLQCDTERIAAPYQHQSPLSEVYADQNQGLKLQESKKMKLGEDWASKSLPPGQNALLHNNMLPSLTTLKSEAKLCNDASGLCKAVFVLDFDREDREKIKESIFRPGISITCFEGIWVLTGRFDPLVLEEELRDIRSVDLLSFSVLPLNTYAAKDGRNGYSARKQFEKVLENLRIHNALLEDELQRVNCGVGSKQTVPQESERNGRLDISKLPIECIEHIMSFTSPWDVCSLSTVCRAFRDAAESNSVWDRFLPSEDSDIISRSIAFKTLIFESAKQKYFYLCHNAVFLDDGFLCFTLDKHTGKRCFMIAPTKQSILDGDSDSSWAWDCVREARFSLVPELKYGPALGFVGSMECKLLPPKTTYVAYLVFKLADCSYGFEAIPVELFIYFDDGELGDLCIFLGDGEVGGLKRRVLLDPPEEMPKGPQERPDGWKEIRMGQFCIGHQDDRTINCCLRRSENIGEKRFRGIIINGIEIRPKDTC